MQLDEVREQYKIIARSANSRAQQRKLEFLEHNLEALNSVQKQVRTGSARSHSTAVQALD
jgi:kinesin family protein 5